MTQYDAATEETEDRFYAQYDSREVKLMTLDQLVEAFEAGEIHENTFVCREGESEWDTLASVAGLGEEEEAQAAPEPVLERRPPMPNRVPEGAVQTRPPMPNRGPDLGAERRPPMPNRAPDVGGERRPAMPSRRPGMDTIPASRQISAYPSVAPARVAPSTPLSFAPVATNIDYGSLDLDDMALRPKRRGAKIAGAMAVLGIVGGAAAFIATGGLHSFAVPSMGAIENAGQKSQASLSLSNIDTKPSAPAPVAPPPAPPPTPAAAPTSDSSSASSSSGQTANAGFSDDMKQALLTADKERANKHSAKVKARASATVAHHGGGRAGGSNGLKSGGSAYDPLNGKL